MKNIVQKNFLFIILFAVIGILFIKRYSYLQVSIVSKPDSQVVFSTNDSILEQTWQPEVKLLTSVDVPYYAENDFSCEMYMEIFSDDYAAVLGQAVQKAAFRAGESGKMTFDLGRIKLIQGERYRIQLSFLESSEEGTLQIPSGSNYGGCSISGEDMGQAAALDITFMKSSRLFWLMAVLFPIFAYSLFMMVITGRKWEETVAVSVFLEGIILYFFGLTEHLRWGLTFIYILGLWVFLITIYFYNKKGLTVKRLLSPGLWIYIALFFVILITSNSDWLGMRDDLRHWGIAVRDMFYYDSFAKHINTTVILPRYLPFTTLIEYVFEYANGMFHEGILLVAYQTMLLSVSIIFCRLLQGKEKKKLMLPVIASMICIPVIFFQNISSTIMVDSLMAVIMGYVLICYYSDEMSWFNRVRISSALCALALTKEIGLALAGVTALIIFGDIFFRGIRERRINFKGLLYPVACVCLVLGLYFSWQIYLSIPLPSQIEENTNTEIADHELETAKDQGTVEKKADVIEQSQNAIEVSGISLVGFKNIITGKGEWYQYQVTRNLLIELLDGETFSVGTVKFSFVDLLLLIAFLIVTLNFFGYWSKEKMRRYIFSGMVLLGGVCFCAFLQVTYWFTFEMYEAMDLTSIDRYLAPYLCAIMMVGIYFIFEGDEYSTWERKKSDYLVYVLALFIIMVMPVEGLIFESNDLVDNTTQENTYGYDMITEILRSMADRGEKVHFICSNSDGYAGYIFRNSVCPIVSEYDNWNVVSNQELYDKQYELYSDGEITIHNTAWVVSEEALKETFRKCKYVVVFHADELFKQSYSELFTGTVIQDGSVYQVVNDTDGVTLHLVGSTEIRGYH